MNVENIKRVRDHIASLPPERFDMGDWGPGARELVHDFGTAACIGGWAEAVLDPNSEGPAAKELFELTDNQSSDLFFMSRCDQTKFGRTIPQAVRVLDILIETGEVDWDRAIAEAPAQPVEA